MDDVITLITEEVIGCDDYGNERIRRTEREVFCQVYGVTRREFYQAAAVGLQPELTIRLSDFLDYAGEKTARFHGDLYSIIRTYRDSGSFRGGSGLGLNGIELVLQRRIGDEESEDSE